jgi:neutral ceramidase
VARSGALPRANGQGRPRYHRRSLAADPVAWQRPASTMTLRIALLALLALVLPARADDPCAGNTSFLVGTGIYDVTGPAGGAVMMGYAMPWQTTGGIHTRLRARAFVVVSPCNGRRLAFVSVDVGLLTQAVKRAVVTEMRERFGADYSDDNVMLSATHTHSAPGGTSHYPLYDVTVLGFDARNFAAVSTGIVEALARAHANLTPGTLRLAAGELVGASINRSPDAYARNPADERARFASDTDTGMTVVRIDAADGRPLGMISWFPVHATSMGNDNHLISGDNKGFASYLFERRMGTDYAAPRTFVAAFAQSHEGDVSPNIYGGTDGGGADDFASTALSGRKQFELGTLLYDQASTPLRGGIDYRHAYVAMDAVAIRPEFADGQPRTTCPAAIGVSMLAGAEDGRGVGYEGFGCTPPENLVERLVCAVASTECQGAKPISVAMGSMPPFPWTPEVLPLQIARIGQLGLIAVPFELTTMSGRRVLETVGAELAPAGIDRLVIAGLANAYAGYVVTPEEYALQHYEGASTHFGPWTLGAVRQELRRVAAALRRGAAVEPGPAPRDISDATWSLLPGVWFDDAPMGERFGNVARDAAPWYARGDTVQVEFWGGHPANDLRPQDSFLRVERLDVEGWTAVAHDWDWETKFRWRRSRCLPTLMCSLVTVEWTIPADAQPGIYRIRHDGSALAWSGELTPYTGISRQFTVR